MTQTYAAERGALTHRSGSSRKLLARKAAALSTATTGAALEDAFPAAEQYGPPAPVLALADVPDTVAASVVAEHTHDQADAPPVPTAEPASAPSDQPAPEQARAPAAAPAWSSEDESVVQALLERRESAGYQRRGKDVGGQLLRVGDIAPNSGTVVSVLVGLVADRGTIARSALLDAMASATFPHAKAKPENRGWCQGYVAGAVRDGFLALAGKPTNAAEVTL